MKNKLFSIALLISACSLNIFSGQSNQDFKKNMNIILQNSKSEDKNTLANKIMNHLYKKNKDKNLADFSFLAKILEQQESTQVDFSLAQKEGIQESLDKFFNLQFPNLLKNSEFIKGCRSFYYNKDVPSDIDPIKELAEGTTTIIYPEEKNITDTQKRHAYQILIDLEALLALHQAKNKNAAIQKLNTFPHNYIWQLIAATDYAQLPEDFKWLLLEPLTTALATHYKNGMRDADVKKFIETIQNFYHPNTSILLPPYKKYTLQHNWVNSAQFSPDGTQIVTASNGNTAKVWDVETKKLLHTLPHLDHVKSAQFSPDGTQIVTVSRNNTTQVWDANTGALSCTLQHTDDVLSAQFSPDGKQIVTASADNTAKIWDANTEKLLYTLTLQHTNLVKSAQFSPDGKKIVTASWGCTAQIWDTNTRALLHTLKHTDDVFSAKFSPDGTQIVTASWDKTAKIWDANTGALLHTLLHTSGVSSAQFSPDGTQIITTSWSKTAKIWDANTGKLLHTLRHTNWVKSAQFSPDGTQIITASDDENTAKVWDANTKELLHTLEDTNKVKSAQFSPDGKQIVTTSWDGTAKVWELNDALEVTPAERILYEAFKKSGLTTFNNVTDTSYANTIIKQLNARVEKLNPKIKPLIPVQ